MSDVIKIFNEGRVASAGTMIEAGSLAWNEHAAFKGVFLKHLIKGEAAGGKFSCHLVRIGAGKEIGDHVHEGKWELHEVIAGSGIGVVDGKEIPYGPGLIAVIPEGTKHKIVAGREDVYLLAKFVPPLL
jgi:mannose-6-phosphate isomerase-like protein (cupin superfamily)